MSKKTYKVLPKWFTKTDDLGHQIATWCKRVTDAEVICTVCNKNICCERKGFAALTQHVSTEMHKENASVKLHSNQLLLKPSVEMLDKSASGNENAEVSQLKLFNNREAVIKAEIIWALKSVQCNMAASVNVDLKIIFSAMFPDDSLAKQFQLGRTKFSYLITEALGPYFRQELLVDAKKSYYSLLFDETTNNADKKELQFGIRFWSEEEKQIVCRHLQTVFLGHATANDIVCQIFKVLDSTGLPVNKLLMLGSDGPNVNKKVWNIINNKLIEDRGQGLIDIGTCYIHVINNAFLKALAEYGDTACELIYGLYNFFKKFPSRWQDFEQAQKKKNVPKHRFIKHVSNRWLTVGPASERVLEQWPAIEAYFLEFVPVHEKNLTKTEKYKFIVKAIKYIDVKVELSFIVDSAEIYAHFTELFLHSEPLIHVLHQELHDILKKIAGRIFKPDAITVDQLAEPSKLLKLSEMDCGLKTSYQIDNLKEKDRPSVLHKIQNHYVTSFNYLVKKIVFERDNVLSHFQFLHMKKIKDKKSLNSIGEICKLLSFMGLKDLDVKDEWRILQTEVKIPDSDVRIDHFWGNILYSVNDLGHLKYPSLNKIIKACLSLTHGNSDVERGFSVSRRVLAEDKSCMSERVLNDRLIIKDSLKKYENVSQVPITKELLNLAYSARKSYELYLEEQKRLKEEELKEKEKKEQHLKAQKEKEEFDKLQKEKLMDLKGSVKKLEDKAKLISEEKKDVQDRADLLFKDANQRLKIAIKNKDYEGIKIAQGMLEGTLKLREEERKHENKEEKLNKIVHKRKSSLIDSFFKKKPKN